jgi:hypothetical protein
MSQLVTQKIYFVYNITFYVCNLDKLKELLVSEETQ